MFALEDDLHCEHIGEFQSLDEAIAEVRRLCDLAWDEAPNQAPCTGWRTCGRNYEIAEYDDSASPWRLLRRIPALNVSAEGKEWLLAANRAP